MKEKKQRLGEVDFLRGVAIIAMIIIHCTAYYLSNPLANWLWNYNQFAVQAFVFCSSYIYFQKGVQPQSFFDFNYFKKRFWRLVQPYYLFLPLFIGLLYFYHQKLSFSYIRDSILLIGGVDINWLTLLFIQLSVLIPFIQYTRTKKPLYYSVFSALVWLSTLYFLFFKLPFSWKWSLWLPWTSIILFSVYYTAWSKSWFKMILGFVGSVVVTFGSFTLLKMIGHSTGFFDNKYPPNLFFLAYGVACILAIIALYKGVFQHLPPLTKLVDFFSRNSYTLFFIHYFVLFFVTLQFHYWNWHWQNLFAAVFFPSIIIQIAFNYILRLLPKKK